ncbi:MAG: hypothetical protein WCJ55_19895 [Chloroflexales bacterium]
MKHNTASSERLNTFRSRLAVLGRRTRRSARNMATVAQRQRRIDRIGTP